jgi:Co/Zn/Cd efflux system component
VIDIDTEKKMITILAVFLSAFFVLALIGGAVSGSVKTLG